MLWDQVAGHAAAVHSLQMAVSQERINHAYLFTGPSAVGKFIAARVFAASILCPQGGCGECNTCRRVMEEKHPDVTVIRPAGKNIPVETIRQVRLDSFRKPVESDHRIYIIKNADRMWDEGASTLLKVLEEPPANVVFILLTVNPLGMLPTIRSRCHEIAFSLVPPADLKEYILERKDVTAEQAELVVRLTGGVLGRALDWCDEPWRLARRENVVRIARAVRRADLNQMLEMAGELMREVRAPVDEIAAVYQEKKLALSDGTLDDAVVKRFSKEFDEECKRSQIREETRAVKEVLATLAWWYRDILITREGGGPDLLVNIDFEQEIIDEAEAIPELKLLECIRLIGESMSAAEQNVPAQLNLESTLLGIQEALYA